MENGGLVPNDVAGEEAADELLAALSDIAYSDPHVPLLQDVPAKYSSRFFFTISESMTDYVKGRQAKVKPKQMVHIDSEIEKRLTAYKGELPEQLKSNISAVREFFLTEIAPLSLSSGAGAIQAKEIAQRMLGTEIDSTQFDKFERMGQAAVNIRMAKFVANYYSLPLGNAAKILESIVPRPPITVPLEQPYEPRHTKARRDRNENQTASQSKKQDTGQ